LSKWIAVASGKGGTGKTTVAAGLALAVRSKIGRSQFIDCDVEQPNADLLMEPTFDGSKTVTLDIPRVDLSKCTGCGKCKEICQYNAVVVVKGEALIFENLCHSCGGCALVCPESAIIEEAKAIGRIDTGSLDNIRFLRGLLKVGEPMSTPIIRALKAEAEDDLLTILDAPPGTACPVIATIKDCAFCILVTEPTPFGLYDLDLMVKVIRELGVPGGVVINKDDAWGQNIEEYASANGLPILLRIPFSRDIAVSYSKGIPLNRVDDAWDERLFDLYARISEEVE
jgi:MinD superfamily P-loop ATPase